MKRTKKILLLHRTFPGQFKHLAQALIDNPAYELMGIRRRCKENETAPSFPVIEYELNDPEDVRGTPRTLSSLASAIAVAHALTSLRDRGYVPDVCLGHIGWGETIHFKDVYPNVPLIGYCEFFHHFSGADFGFDPEFVQPDHEDAYRIRQMNATEALALLSVDIGVAPTHWQRNLFPSVHRHHLRVIHEGVDLTFFQPDNEATLRLPSGRILRAGDKIVTFATHSLEPYRGLHTFFRAIPLIQALHPDAEIIVAGGDEALYGSPPPGGLSWREYLLQGLDIQLDRLHFVGFLAPGDYRAMLQISAVHIYLTVPFVLSWSLLEAMAVGCILVASDTAPVKEVLTDGVNSRLVNFFSSGELAERVSEILASPTVYQTLGVAARRDAEAHYDATESVQRYLALLDAVTEIQR